MTEAELSLEIDRIASRRLDLRLEGGDSGELAVLNRELLNLFEEKRHLVARDRSGRSRADILRGARVESELERLSSR